MRRSGQDAHMSGVTQTIDDGGDVHIGGRILVPPGAGTEENKLCETLGGGGGIKGLHGLPPGVGHSGSSGFNRPLIPIYHPAGFEIRARGEARRMRRRSRS